MCRSSGKYLVRHGWPTGFSPFSLPTHGLTLDLGGTTPTVWRVRACVCVCVCVWCLQPCVAGGMDEGVQRVLGEKGVKEALSDPEIQHLVRSLKEDSRKAQKYVP